MDEREKLTEILINQYGYTKELLDTLDEDDFYDQAEKVIPNLYDDAVYRIEGANDQKAKSDAGKPVYSRVPPAILKAIEQVRSYGNVKYPGNPDNWKDVSTDRHWEAYLRHTVAAWEDYKAVDKESGLPHIFHAACDLAFVIAKMGEQV